MWCEILGTPIASVFDVNSSKSQTKTKSYIETFSKLSPKYQDLVLGHLEMVYKLDKEE